MDGLLGGIHVYKKLEPGGGGGGEGWKISHGETSLSEKCGHFLWRVLVNLAQK